MSKILSYGFRVLVTVVVVAFASSTALGEEFYRGKILRFIVAFSAGGGFDTYTRAIARHIGRHIPGNPTTLVENMTGAGGIIAANHMYNKATPDGLTVGNFIGGLVMLQIFEKKGIQFDARKFEWIGVPSSDHAVCALSKASGVDSIEKWLASPKPLKIGGVGPGGQASDIPRVLGASIRVPVKVIDGYGGTARIRLAVERGELDGGCWAWQSVKVTWTNALAAGDVRVVVQAMPSKHPDLKDVPLASDFAKTDEAKLLLKAGISDTARITRFYSLPPGTPKERVQILRKAFMDTMNDPEFLADTKKSKLEIDALPGEEVARLVSGLFELDSAVIAKLKEIIIPK